MSAPKQYCTFLLGDLFFGIDVLRVQEVILHQEMTDVPLSSAIVRGLINLRGETVTAIELRKRLELDDDSPPAESQKNVIINAEGGAVSLIVDEIGDVIEPDESRFAPPPDTVRGVAKELITSVCQLDTRLMLILDIDRVVDFDAAIS